MQGVGRNGLTWNFTAIPDRAPNIALTRDPERQARGALRLDYRMEDDYGVTDAKAIFSRKNEPGKAGVTPRPLFDAPQLNLVLPQQRARNGVAQTIHDFSEHPWAGGDVELALIARDEAGNEGRSEAREIFLPQRVFVKPMARALVEQRRILALDANAKPVVLTALDALTMAPDKFKIETNIYLGLRSIYFDLNGAKTDDRLRDVVARLWAMAIQIEDGSLSDVEQALRQAQEALRQALERGASDEELKKLMDQLRAAMDRFLQRLCRRCRRIRSSYRVRSIATAACSASRISRACLIAWSSSRALAIAMPRAACSKSCSRCWRISRRRSRAAKWARTKTT